MNAAERAIAKLLLAEEKRRDAAEREAQFYRNLTGDDEYFHVYFSRLALMALVVFLLAFWLVFGG